MDHSDSFTYRNASPGGQILDTYTDAARARIRAVLLDYNAENKLSVEGLFKRLCAAERGSENVGFSFKTFQRFLAGSRETRPETVAVCARFAKGLPNRPGPFHALGEALYALYKKPLNAEIAGSYTLTSGDLISTQISISAPAQGFALVSEKHTSPLHRLHDGVLVSTAPGEYLMLLRDRLMLTPRYITTLAGTKHVEPIAFVSDHPSPLYPARLPASYTAVFIPKAD
jgi:hypothetical protein